MIRFSRCTIQQCCKISENSIVMWPVCRHWSHETTIIISKLYCWSIYACSVLTLFITDRGELFTAKYPLTDQTLTKLQFPQRPSKRSLLSLTLISGERVALIHAKQRIYELGYQLHSAMKRSELADVSIDFQ